jgi:hypothetical protein
MADINRVFTELPCLSCNDWRADRLKARIGEVYLLARDGKPLPKMDPVLTGCCRRAAEEPDQRVIMTFSYH